MVFLSSWNGQKGLPLTCTYLPNKCVFLSSGPVRKDKGCVEGQAGLRLETMKTKKQSQGVHCLPLLSPSPVTARVGPGSGEDGVGESDWACAGSPDFCSDESGQRREADGREGTGAAAWWHCCTEPPFLGIVSRLCVHGNGLRQHIQPRLWSPVCPLPRGPAAWLCL